MAKERTIVYGLGKMFAKHYAQIHQDYNVIGYCDTDCTNRERFASSLPPRELADKMSSFDVLLVTPRKGLDIAVGLVTKYGIDSRKIRLLCQPAPSRSFGSKRNSNLPDMVVHGTYQEDMAVLYLCKKLGLECKHLHYWEAGLSHILKGSATYCLYREGARGLLLLQSRDDHEKQAKVYRPEDRLLIMDSETTASLLECRDEPDVVSLQENCSIESWLEVVYAKKPLILTVIARDSGMLDNIIAHGYTWFTSLQGTCAVFYYLRKEV